MWTCEPYHVYTLFQGNHSLLTTLPRIRKYTVYVSLTFTTTTPIPPYLTTSICRHTPERVHYSWGKRWESLSSPSLRGLWLYKVEKVRIWSITFLKSDFKIFAFRQLYQINSVWGQRRLVSLVSAAQLLKRCGCHFWPPKQRSTNITNSNNVSTDRSTVTLIHYQQVIPFNKSINQFVVPSGQTKLKADNSAVLLRLQTC